MGAYHARVMYVACTPQGRAEISPTHTPQQPQGCPCRSRAHTGAPDGISGGASWRTVARQTRIGASLSTTRMSPIASEVNCAHDGDASERRHAL